MPMRPNLILITADQLRWDALGYAGNPDARTPNLDALAANGVDFTQATTTAAICAAARASILTGAQTWEHGVRANGGALPPDRTTLPERLRAIGYNAACIGKLHFPPAQAAGFDDLARAETGAEARMHDDYHPWLAENGLHDRIEHWDQAARDEAPLAYWQSYGAMRSNLAEQNHVTAWIGSRAVRWLQSVQQPFFLWLSFTRPHHPFDPPAPWDRAYDPAALALPDHFQAPPPDADLRPGAHFDLRRMNEARFRRILAYYYANISFIDAQIGRVLATLTARGIANNIIVFTADHGDYMGHHGLILKGAARPYDPVLRIPMLVCGAAGQLRGVRDPGLVQLHDLMPSFLEAAGAPPAEDASGISLVPRLHGAAGPHRPAAAAIAPENARIARTANHKLVHAPDPGIAGAFDLAADPGEWQPRPHDAPAFADLAPYLPPACSGAGLPADPAPR